MDTNKNSIQNESTNDSLLIGIKEIVPNNNCGLLSIGMKAPEFTAVTTMGTLSMSDFIGRWVVFFSHPGAFSPVCTTEYLSFSNMYKSFDEINAQIIALSVNSNLSHLAWLNQIYHEEKVIVPFPVISDLNGSIARQYGMISEHSSEAVAARNVIIIDPDQIIRALLIYPLSNGRNIPEILRLLTALQTSDKYDVVTPANWFTNQAVMVEAPYTYDAMVKRQFDSINMELSCRQWWWCYKQLPTDSDK